MEITGYHGTCSAYRQSIAEFGLDPSRVRTRADHWLGQGVYFFTNYLHAQWWADSIAGRQQGSVPVIYRAVIQVEQDKLLNLDDNNSVALFYERILDVFQAQKTSACKKPVFTREDRLRAVYFDYYKQRFDISVIMYTFSKDCVRYTDFFQTGERLSAQKELAKLLQVHFSEQQICVSDKSCIRDLTVIYDGDNEVI